MNAIQTLLTEHIDIWTAADTEKKSGRGRSAGNAASVYGIRKLRELILELAVRGKLVPQKSEWRKQKLGDLGFWAIGSGFPTLEQGSQNDDILFVKVSDMNLTGNEKFIVVANNTITNETAIRLKIKVHAAGTVIFPKIGGAIATNKRRILTRSTAIDNNCLGLTPKGDVSTDWLYLLLSSIDLSKYQAGTSVPALSQGVLQEIPVMLPEVAEQHRIVAKVDELMVLCDQLETQHNNTAEAHEKLVSHLLGTLTQSQSAADFSANWQRIAAHFDTLFTTEASIDALKQTLLQLAVMGKLVPQDPKDEPASELVKRIQIEKAKLIAEGKIKKDKPLSPITDEEKPFGLPVGWEWARMIDCAKQITDGEHLTPQRSPDSTKIPLVTAKNVRDGNMDYENTDYVDFDVATKCWNRCKPELNDILIVSVGATIGRLTIVDDHRDMVIVRSVTLVKPLLVNIPYLALSLRSPYLQTRIWSGVKQNAQPCLYLSVSNSLPIPVPPLAEQLRIVAKVDELMDLCEKLKTRINNARQYQRKLAEVMVEQTVT